MKLITRPPAFTYKKDRLNAERIPMESLAQKYGTPLYVYSASTIRDRFQTFDKAFARIPHTICYSVKANSNISLLKLLAKLGSGFDVVSGGELERVLQVSKKAAQQVVFSGVGKTAPEMDLALKAGIFFFNVESVGELELLASRSAKLKQRARLALRVNPDIFAKTHPYISTGLQEHKFGISIAKARDIYQCAAQSKWLEVAGVSVHIGSQITSIEPFVAAMKRIADLVRDLIFDGHNIRYVDAGGGLGIPYTPEENRGYRFPAMVRSYAQSITKVLKPLGVHLLLEPGRSIVGPAGALLIRVMYVKGNGKKVFLVVDAAMNDLIRPSLYSAYHEIVPISPHTENRLNYDVVGPVCESGDFFARDRELPVVSEGDLMAILDAGAYGMSLASNYNSRPRPAEVMVDGDKSKLVRQRETIKDLLRNEL